MTVLRAAVSLSALGLVAFFYWEQLPAVLQQLARVEPLPFGLSLAAFFGGLVFLAVRLRLILLAHRASITTRQVYHLNLVALFFNNVLPSSLGGEAVKAYYLYRGTGGLLASFGAVLMDRICGLLTVVLVGSLSLALWAQDLASERIVRSLEVLAAVTVVALLVLFNRTISDWVHRARVPLLPPQVTAMLRDLFATIHFYRHRPLVLLGAVGLSVAGQFFFVLNIYYLAVSLGIAIPLTFFFAFLPICAVTGLAPSMNGVGVREATFIFFLHAYAPADQALALSLLTTVSLILIGMAGGVAYALKGGGMAAQELQPAAVESCPADRPVSR
ncbi:MAG: lysylphosphatidylglycerol synthase transmembrane domain-containing protein [Thermodesulfobacteriota bacterium]